MAVYDKVQLNVMKMMEVMKVNLGRVKLSMTVDVCSYFTAIFTTF